MSLQLIEKAAALKVEKKDKTKLILRLKKKKKC